MFSFDAGGYEEVYGHSDARWNGVFGLLTEFDGAFVSGAPRPALVGRQALEAGA